MFLAYLGLEIPFVDWLVFKVRQFAIFVPIVGVVLYPVNQTIKLWRKRRGRDIDTEEKHETESGLISISEKSK